MTKLIRELFIVFLFAGLTACGGGGGSPGNTSGVALFTTAADKIVVSPGEIQTYSIGGGVPSYSGTSNSAAANASVSGKTLTITGGGGGTATITVKDAAGATIKIDVTVGTGLDLYSTAPLAITVGLGASSSIYSIGGGSQVYDVTSSNRQIAAIARTGNTFSISGVGVGKATVSITDSLGKAVSISVTVGSIDPLFTTAPSAVTVGVGATSSVYTIGGGSQVYDVGVSNKQVATIGRSGNTFIITGVTAGKATISVKDSVGAAITIDLIVGSSDAMFTTAASDITLAIGAANTYKIGGGNTPYSVGSSNVGVATASILGSDLTITAISAGSATVVVRDAIAGSIEIKVTVGAGAVIPLFSTAPSDIVVVPLTSPTFTIGGGKAPYFVSTSNASVITSTVSGTTLTINGLVVGTAKLQLTDSAGALIAINVNVGAGAVVPLFTTAPSSITLVSGVAVPYTISGGTSPYTVTSSNISVATVSAVGSSFVINGITAGTSQIVIRDSIGATVNVSVVVTAVATTVLDILPNGATGSVGDTLTFQVVGGSPNFSISNNNASIAAISATTVGAGGVFTAKLLNVGNTIVTVVDSQGVSKAISVTVVQGSPTLRLSPSGFTVGENTIGNIDLTIYGGTSPYFAFTSDLTKSSVSISGNKFTIAMGTNGNRCINPVDASGTYVISGTYDVTFTLVDSLGASAISVMTIKDNGKGLGLGCP